MKLVNWFALVVVWLILSVFVIIFRELLSLRLGAYMNSWIILKFFGLTKWTGILHTDKTKNINKAYAVAV